MAALLGDNRVSDISIHAPREGGDMTNANAPDIMRL